jgi:hypothetical protein
MPLVQDILILFQTSPGLDSAAIGWSRYESSKGTRISDLVDELEPPYENAMEAMRDGWQVIQMSELKPRSPDDAYEDGPLPYQTVLAQYREIENEKGEEQT